MAETEGTHRRKQEEKVLEANIDGMRRHFQEARIGQVFALIVSLSFVGAGTYMAVNGHGTAGTILGSLGLSSIVASFIKGRSREAPVPPEAPRPQPATEQQTADA